MDVLRASYIIPRYSLGLLHGTNVTGRLELKIAKDQDDWHEYYVNCFVDRDMLMRYLWGYGVGHTYSHQNAPDVLPQPQTRVTTNIPVQWLQDSPFHGDTLLSPHPQGSSHSARAGPSQIQLAESTSAAGHLGGVDGKEERHDDDTPDDLEEGEHRNDTLENLEEEELAVATPEEEDEEENMEEWDVQEPEPDGNSEDLC